MHRPSPRFAKHSLYLAATAFAVTALPLAVMARVKPALELPPAFDVRQAALRQTGPKPRAITTAQLRWLQILQGKVGTPLTVRYNGLTATPRYLFAQGGVLSAPSLDAPEMIARHFLRDNADLYRFSEADLNGLRLRTRSTVPGTKTTVLVFEQQVDGVPVYQGDVLVNVGMSGQVLSVGNDNYPQLTVTNRRSISQAQAVSAAAAAVGVPNYSPASIGLKPVLNTYGEMSPQYIQAESFASDAHFSREIRVVPVLFPLGDTARQAWKFNVVDRAHMGIMWQNVVDADTGVVLSRISLTAFQQGGGVGKGRLSTFRPDVQDYVESKNAAMTAKGLVFDDQPTVLSGAGGFGRSTRSGTAPNYSYKAPFYGASTLAAGDDGYKFRYVLLTGRNKNGLPFDDKNTAATVETFTQAALPGKLGQVLRGFPDAVNPSAASPLGWFYLPTGPNGAEIAAGNTDHTTTRAFGYTMTAEAKTRNKVFATNGPGSDGNQPFSATLTTLPGPVTLADGRVLSSVWQTSYTEGNNVLVADDRANDDETTLGIRGYSATRDFTASYFDFVGGYEYGVDATSTNSGVNYPPGADVDVPSSDLSLFNINNLVHDYMYSIGFTEPMWNFQQDNFGKGGAGGDGLRAQTMDGSGLDNANMGTPADGDYPTMQMFLNTDGSGFERRSDSAYEWDTVAHEHYHGVSNRSAAKGDSGCLGLALLGEPGGEGEGWGDFFADSVSEADNVFDYTSGVLDAGLRAMPSTNYRWSYGSINGQFMRRDSRTNPAAPDGNSNTPFEVHQVGEIFTPMLWDMRELLIAKDPNGVFYDGTRRLGSGTTYYIGDRKVQSVDTEHPIDFRVGFNTTTNDLFASVPNPQGATGGGAVPTLDDKHAIRSGLVADEIKRLGNRQGPMASAVSNGGRLADTLVLRGLQLGLCNPTIVDTRDSILQADQQLNGGENRSLIWRAFASHGVGNLATSTGNPTGAAAADNPVTSTLPVIVEDFSVPTAVTTCETSGPLPSPGVSLAKSGTTVTLTLTPTTGANNFVISRSSSAKGAYALLGTVAAPTAGTATYADSNLTLNSTYYYRVRQARDVAGECVSQSKDADIKSITLGTPAAVNTAPIARLSTDKDGGVAPLSVAFEAITSSDPDSGDAVVSYSFDLDGDGTYELVNSTSSAASKTYPTAGTYVAKLKVKDRSGLESAVVTKTITVTAPSTTATNTAPTAQLKADKTAGMSPLTVVFDASSSSDPDAGDRVAGYSFDLDGDGVYEIDYGTAAVQSKTYNLAGSYVAKLKVRDAQGLESAPKSVTITVTAAPQGDNAPVAALSSDTAMGLAPLAVTFDASGSSDPDAGDAVASYSFDLDGDDIYEIVGSGNAKPTKTYDSAGVYSAKVKVKDKSGAESAAVVRTITVNDPAVLAAGDNRAPVAVFSAINQTGSAPLTVQLTGDHSFDPDAGDTIALYRFDFGDGSPVSSSATKEVTHIYTAPGRHLASLVVTDSHGTMSEPKTLTMQVDQTSSASGDRHGSGGALDWRLLGGLLLMLGLPRRGQRRRLALKSAEIDAVSRRC